MEVKQISYNEYADQHFKDKYASIENTLKNKTKPLNRLVYLAVELNNVSEDLDSSRDLKKSFIKSSVNDAYERDQVHIYMQDDSCTRDFTLFKEQWNKIDRDYIEDKRKHSVETFLTNNRNVIAPEIKESLIIANTKEVNKLSKELIAGVCLANNMLKDELIRKFEIEAHKQGLTQQEMEDLMKRTSHKITWLGDVNEFALLFNLLIDCNLVEQPGSSAKQKAEFFEPHFRVNGKTRGTLASMRSLQDEFGKVDKAIGRGVKLKKVIEDFKAII